MVLGGRYNRRYMNKLLPVVVIVFLLIGGGAFFLSQQNKNAGETPESAMTEKKEDGNVFTSIQDALSRSLSLECSYTDPEGTTAKTYIKAGAVRSEVTATGTDGATTYMIMKDRKLYSWDPETKKGTLMTIPDPATITPPAVPTGAMEDSSDATAGEEESFLTEIEKYKDACKPATVADSLFVPPTDVTFQDLSSLMEDVIKDVPANAMPSGFNLEELQKQYMPQ